MAQTTKVRTPRRKRRRPPVRTPVEGDWLRLHKGTGQGYVIAKHADGHRRRTYLGPYYEVDGRTVCRETVERAARWLREAGVLGTAVPRRPDEPLTVADLAERFLVHADDYYANSRNERDHYRTLLDLVCSLYGSTPAGSFGPLALKAVRQHMIDTDRWTRETLNGHIGRIKRVFKWAASNELIPATVWRSLQTVDGLRRGRSNAREGGRVAPVSDDHIDAVLPRLSRQVRAMIAIQRSTGCRPGEVVILRPCDVDRSEEVWVYTPSTHKNTHRGHSRRIYLGPRAQDALLPFLLRSATENAFCPAEAESARREALHAERVTGVTSGNVPGSNRLRRPTRVPGTRYTTSSYAQAIRRACDATNTPRWSPNQLRHSVATRLRRDYGIEAARVALGHTDAGTTQIYAEADEQLARTVAAEVG